MKAESLIFVITTIFFVLVTPAYWFITGDPTGTSALTMTALLAGMVAAYLSFHASKMDPRPEDRKEGEIADGAGELGFFPPYSWWPLWLSLAGSLVFLGVAVGLWVSAFGALVGVWALCGWVFEYYKGEHAH